MMRPLGRLLAVVSIALGLVTTTLGTAHADGWVFYHNYATKEGCVQAGQYLKWVHHPHIATYKCDYRGPGQSCPYALSVYLVE